MKISLKIFVFTYCIMMCITVFGGFAIVNYLYHQDMNAAMEAAADSNANLYTYIASLEDIPDNSYAEYSLAGFEQRMSGRNKNSELFVGNHEEWLNKIKLEGYRDLEKGQVISSVINTDNGLCIQVTSRYEDRYLISYYDIENVLRQRDSNYRFYRRIIIIVSMVIAIVLYLFSWYITRPVSKVTEMAEEISAGNYSVRVDTDYRKMKSYEVAKLGEILNELARNTEEHIIELEDIARKREDFVSDFTHEIKTPLTSIIGYADLLRTYDLQPDKKREYSSFIYNEGKRLEQLSLNLLQLIVMGKSDFNIEPVSTKVLLDKLKEAVYFTGEKYSINIEFECQNAMIMVEESLVMTALINLVDNACKASEPNQSVFVNGHLSDDNRCYEITVSDNGHGIPADELSRITEPFYMVDKSRARSQGGAGLGLALCKKISEIHGGALRFESVVGEGTSVTLSVVLAGDYDED